MKKLFLFFSLVMATILAQAQQNTETNKPLVNYSIVKADSSIATRAMLKKNKPVMVIYFEPSCTHCEHLMEELRPKMAELKNIQVVMITYTQTEYPFLRLLKDFNKKYNLAKYPNFTVGTEYTPKKNYPVMRYYTIYTTPFIAIYGTNRKVVKSFSNVPTADELLAAVKKAK